MSNELSRQIERIIKKRKNPAGTSEFHRLVDTMELDIMQRRAEQLSEDKESLITENQDLNKKLSTRDKAVVRLIANIDKLKEKLKIAEKPPKEVKKPREKKKKNDSD